MKKSGKQAAKRTMEKRSFIRADEFFDSVYEFCRSESMVIAYSEKYREGMKKCMRVLQGLNMIVCSTVPVDGELLGILVRTMRRRVDARYEKAMESTVDWMQKIAGEV